ncbi:ankyrin repeat and zinc finger domain-containing protein 1-like [Eriocheir sinensis]|uniref:ankyrin repeat and zinc finger domain-containing protein 1-like n=1 Tax=Eriocheir sinensis TaxID=95602 RepID=UPI0021C849EF|nr:ankyrin repeat and zinc finger domain-containing protein 1-like [Eriocheir sinensis]XP_050730825.1 ankyrin repeat and zinc finger domain-containing protein 1-like [Eriocheir sinensis]XP_050730826.1 ankyrin repeat and zinc finger domain-containing protein 1-like [Eriocheir sinensis]XP_050730830.1 ankyrin repeat and zinc finger domain-containing protein 1-like [Eriocheir sinensis]XP_050730839.1 ankyrin repeat and zinc finger domain-containing protein 1-like [Eriocheir sinensis]
MKPIQHVSLWDEGHVSTLLAGIRLAPGSAEYVEVSNQPSSSPSKDHCSIGLPMFRPSLPSAQVGMRCSHCQTAFADREEQVSHYRLDWHRNNLRRSMGGKPPLTEEQFMDESSDMSSISGSEDSSDDDDEEEEEYTKNAETNAPVLKRQAHLFFLNADGYVISLYRNVLYYKSVEIDGEQDVIQRALAAPRKKNWAILLLGGGHFAAAVFRGKEVVIHKTFHNYTVRAKQGGSQGAKDNQSGTAHPKSSGSSLRRYNEQSQRQHVQELMESWKTHLDKCDLIFYHAKHHNGATFFGGKRPILMKNDERLRRIPFPTKRAKFSEVKRVFGLLSEVHVHGKEEDFNAMVREAKIGDVQPVSPKKKANKTNNSRTVERKLKTEKDAPDLPHEESSSESPAESGEEMELVTQFSTFSTSDLGGQHCSLKSKPKKKESSPNSKKGNENKSKRKPNGRNKKVNKGSTHKTKVWDLLHSACKSGNIDHLSVALKVSSVNPEDDSLSQEVLESLAAVDIPADLSKITFGSRSQTLLHVAAESGKHDVIWWLLEHGCDPGVTDAAKRAPFDDSVDKESRNTFRRFMAEWPDKYDYKKAKIPSPLTKDIEEEQAAKMALRRKAQRQAKLGRQREKKQQEKMKLEQEKKLQVEEEERKRFLALSDREKRALAAERRFQEQQQQQDSVLRCFMCAKDISGIIPFEYSDNKFCTTKCVREHRTKES